MSDSPIFSLCACAGPGPGMFSSLSSLPALLVTPFLGVPVEKANRKRLLVACDLLTAACFALLSFSSSLLIPLGITYAGFLASLVGADLACIINNLCVIAIVLLCRAYI